MKRRYINEAKIQRVVNEEVDKMLKEEYELTRLLGALGGGIGGLTNGIFRGEPIDGMFTGIERGWDRQNAKTYSYAPISFFSNLYGNLVDSEEYKSRFLRYDPNSDEEYIKDIRNNIKNYSKQKQEAIAKAEEEERRREEEEARRKAEEEARRKAAEEEYLRQQTEYWREKRERERLDWERKERERLDAERREREREARERQQQDNDRRNQGGNQNKDWIDI